MEYTNRNIRLTKLIEREKELNCLYNTENLLINNERALEDIMLDMTEIIPTGWQFPTVCECKITLGDKVYMTEDFIETEYLQSAEIYADENLEGRIDVIYTQLIRLHKGSAFLPEEQKLLYTIADSIGTTIFRRKLKSTLEYIDKRVDDKDERYRDDMILSPESDQHWKWRWEMVHKLVEHLDLKRFDLKGLYLIGSTKNANAGPGSDIDILVHSGGNTEKAKLFKYWIEGWGRCLDEVNYYKSGYRSISSLIDLHIITDEDIEKKNSYACMINAVTDRARPIKVV
jgi:predicted nucleotidyltransferase